MFYILLENDNQAHLGPIEWNSRMFQNILKDDLGIDITLPVSKSDTNIIDITTSIKIYPASYVYPNTHNPKIEQFAGPVWTIVNGEAIGTFTNVPASVPAVKNTLKAVVAQNRFIEETKGVLITVQGQEVFVTTSRGERDIFLQALQLMGSSDTRLWKFNDIWLTLTQSDLQSIVTAIVAHIQSAFTWENSKVVEIDAATTLVTLDGIVLTV
jgi:hypothetical protein